MEEPEPFHIQERDITATQNILCHKTKNQKHHGLHLSTVQISMKDLHLSMEELKLSHIQEVDITAIQNGQWHKIKNQKHQLHGLN